MRRRAALALVVAGLAVVAAFPATGGATNECKGIQVCIRVPGPWVAVPAQGTATYLLECPRRRGVVGGLDARASSRGVRVSFEGRLGSPVAPGTTTTRYAFFTALSTTGRATFQPLLGCIPAGGTSPRSTTSATVAPGAPLERYAKTLRLRNGTRQSASVGCAAGARLVGGWHAIAFRTKAAPPAALAELVNVTRTTRNGRVAVAVRTSEVMPTAAKAEVQVGAVCAP